MDYIPQRSIGDDLREALRSKGCEVTPDICWILRYVHKRNVGGLQPFISEVVRHCLHINDPNPRLLCNWLIDKGVLELDAAFKPGVSLVVVPDIARILARYETVVD